MQALLSDERSYHTGDGEMETTGDSALPPLTEQRKTSPDPGGWREDFPDT